LIKMIFIFLALAVGFYFGIEALRKLTGKEKWGLTKTLMYSTMCALLAVLTLSGIVILF
jgi:cytochrome c oxidase assembly factor CtaG